MAKPETTFTESVHRHLPSSSELWREKMSNPYRSGGADYWYSDAQDLWVEWKFIQLPKRDDTIINLVTGSATGKTPATVKPLQQAWLHNRHVEGRNVWVIVGCKEGGVVFKDLGWEQPLSTKQFKARMLTRPEIAKAIVNKVS